ncbi:23770_t:CDS:2, partial [Dentiscutata erythropus]
MANTTASKLFEKIIEGSQIINKHDYNLFGDFQSISISPFRTVHTAKWKGSTYVLKSLNINNNEIISNGVVAEITKFINNKTIPKTITNETITNENITNEIITNEIINNETTNEKLIRAFINELQNLVALDKHENPNIIEFYGVTK